MASSDEEAWPIWDELRAKMEALERGQGLGQEGSESVTWTQWSSGTLRHVGRPGWLPWLLLSLLSAIEGSPPAAEPPDYSKGHLDQGCEKVEDDRHGTIERRCSMHREARGHPSSGTPAWEASQEVPTQPPSEFATTSDTNNIIWPWAAGSTSMPPNQVGQSWQAPPLPGMVHSIQGLPGPGYGAGGFLYPQAPYSRTGMGTPTSAAWPFMPAPVVDYHTVPSKVKPYCDVASPLGCQLAPATRFKILRGDFIDLFSLLNTRGRW